MKHLLLKLLIAISFCILTYAQQIPGPVMETKNFNGVPTFYLDGKPYMTPIFETYSPQSKYFKQFSDAGCNIHMFSLSLGPCLQIAGGRAEPIWIGPDKWDFAQLDARAAEVIKGDPNAMLCPRFYIDTPDWWLSHNVSECMVLDTGKNYYTTPIGNAVTTNHLFASLASEKWRTDMSYGIKKIIEHMQNSSYGNRIAGYMITGLYTEEFYHWSIHCGQLADYSEPFRKGFSNWLKNRYSTAENMQKAWSNPSIDFNSVNVPTKEHRMAGKDKLTFRNPAKDMPVIDFYLYYNDVMVEAIDVFCKAAKEATGGRKIVGAFYGYMFEFFGDPEFGHNALEKYNASPNIDYLAVTASYNNRQIGSGADYARSQFTSVLLNNKVWYHDNDTLSFMYRKVMGASDMTDIKKLAEIDAEADRIGAPKTLDETIWQYERTAGFTLSNGLYQSFFDLHGGYFDHPDLMAEVKKLNTIFNESVKYDRSSVSETLLVSDEPSCSYCTFESQMLAKSLLDTQVSLCKMGAGFDSILVNDLAKADMSRYKMVIFLNNFNLTDAQRQLVEQKVKNNNRVVLWAYAPGYFNGNTQIAEAMENLTGIKIVPSNDETFIAPQIDLSASSDCFSKALTDKGLKIIGSENKMCKLFSVRDADAKTLGVLPGTNDITCALKNMNNWTSIYTITPIVPADFYRQAAKLAGVHIYNNKNDALYVSKSYLTINADGAGDREISFPCKVDIYDPLSGKELYKNVYKFTKNLDNKQTLLVRYTSLK